MTEQKHGGHIVGVNGPTLKTSLEDIHRAWLEVQRALLVDEKVGRWIQRSADWVGARVWRRVALRVLFYALLAFMMIGPYLLRANK